MSHLDRGHITLEVHEQQLHPTNGNSQEVAPRVPNAIPQDAQNPTYLHHTSRFWQQYLKDASVEDQHLVDSWKGDTDGILIFTGLFAATVATFVTQTYQLLTPSSNDTSVAILLRVSHQIAGLSNGTFIPAYTPPPFEAPFYAVWVNTLWFLSLFLSLTGALMATLMQQWTRRYLRGIRYRSAPHIRGAMHVGLRLGVKKYKMKQAVALITSIVHASVFFFFTGLVGFAFSLNSTIANVLTTFISALVAAYIVLSFLPIFSTVAPYDTVLTPVLQASPRLGRDLFAFAIKQARKIRLFLWDRDRSERQQTTAGGAEEHRPRSREQDLMQMVRENNYSPAPHFTYVLDRILTNSDQHHEVQEFLDSMIVLLSSDRIARQSLLKSLLFDSALNNLFKHHLLDKICSLLQSCFRPNRLGVSLSMRIKRLRTVVAFIRHEAIQEDIAEHPNLSISFPAQLAAICSYMGADIDGEIRRYSLTDMRATARDWYSPSTDNVEWPLFCFVELVCTILKSSVSDGGDGPVGAYLALWQSILGDAKLYAVRYLRKSLRESENLIAEPIPRALLIATELDHIIPSSNSLPARRPLAEAKQLRIKETFSRYPELRRALHDVALTVPSLIPLDSSLPRPRPDSEPERPSEYSSDGGLRSRAIASLSTTTNSACVSFGPLTWRNHPARECRHLMRACGFEHFLYDMIGDACEILKDHPRGKGYAKICFVYKEKAQEFVDDWKKYRPPVYRDVTAEILDEGESTSGTNGDGIRDAVDAGE